MIQDSKTKNVNKLQESSVNVTPLHLIIITAVTSFLVYFNALFNGFVWDDIHQILGNPWIRDVKHIPEIFSTNVWGFQALESNYYRPLMHIFYMLSYYIFGLHPLGFHLVNILFHGSISVLVYLLSLRLLRGVTPSVSSPFLSPPFVAAI